MFSASGRSGQCIAGASGSEEVSESIPLLIVYNVMCFDTKKASFSIVQKFGISCA